MSPHKRGRVYYIDIRWRGYPRLKLSTDTANKERAIAMEQTVHALRSAGRRDILELLAARRLHLPDVHEAWLKRGDELEQLRARAESPALGELVDRWLEWLRSPAGISPRTKRRYSPRTIVRYNTSWEGFFAVLPRGRDSTLADLTSGFVADYRRGRKRAHGGRERYEGKGSAPLSGGTLNRDMVALSSFLTWCRDVEGLQVIRPRISKEKETAGRERWLSSDELAAFERECPAEWWPLFAVLFYTGARLGEATGLRGADVLLHAKRIAVHEGDRRVKSAHSVRHLPIPQPLEEALGHQLARVSPGPADLVFPDGQDYKAVRRVWDTTCKAAEISGATPHDARHTFGVHAAQAGVPIVRLQKLLGHATPQMTLRYMRHAPESYIDEDGSAIAEHMAGKTDQERDARAQAAREGMRTA